VCITGAGYVCVSVYNSHVYILMMLMVDFWGYGGLYF